MSMNFGISICLITFLLSGSALALDPDKQAVLNRFEAPFGGYLVAVKELGASLDLAKTEADVVKAADRFCDEANRFVDTFNENKDQFANSEVAKAMRNDEESKKAMDAFMESLRSKLVDAKPVFESLVADLNRYKGPSIDRVRNRISATFSRIQLLYSAPDQ